MKINKIRNVVYVPIFVQIVFVFVILVVGLNYVSQDKHAIASDEAVSNVINKSNTQTSGKIKNTKKLSTEKACEPVISDVSMIQLISNPEKFDGKNVSLVGYVRLEFEGDAIYLHEDDLKHGLTKNGLWLSITEGCCGKDIQKFNQKYVLVEGTFNAKNKGHFDLFSGSIENIKRFQEWIVKRPENQKLK